MNIKLSKSSKPTILIVVSISLLFSVTVWFSANAITSQLISLWNLTPRDIAILSIILIIGFVIGALIYSVFNLPDLIKTPLFFSVNTLIAAFGNFFAAMAPNFLVFIIFRFITGFFLAGVYPTSMKLISSWFKRRRGLAIGILLGALTAGSGLPYLFNIFGTPNWRLLLSFSSLFALTGSALIYLFIQEGPHLISGAKFRLSNLKDILGKKSIRLANFSYFGHMWELYAFWVWIPKFLQEVYSRTSFGFDGNLYFSLGTFLVFISGAVGNMIGGKIADTIGRTKFNIIMLIFSGGSSLVIGFSLNNAFLALIIAIIWGTTIVPDSPQYSAMISELSDPAYVGTALAIQTALGFTIANLTIWLIPFIVDLTGWTFAFMILIIGPFFGIVSLFKLRKEQDSIKIAQGRK
ncbi:MAG: MFS transporter [Promethearchaeota archaeon]|jgi:MFS family permease